MKKLLIIAIAFLTLSSCKNKENNSFEKNKDSEKVEHTVSEGMPAETKTLSEQGAAIFAGKGNCVGCHKVDEKLIGPSLQDIAKVYKEKNGNIVAFLKGENDAIVDPSQFALMQANIALTKTFSDQELKSLEAYINSISN